MLMESFWMAPRPRNMHVTLMSTVANMSEGLANKKGGKAVALAQGEASFKGQPWQDLSKLHVLSCHR